MGPSGAICGPRVPSSPFSQSRSVGSCACSSWAQASSAASERIRMFFCMGGPPGSRKQKIRIASSNLQFGQRGPGDRVEQGPCVLGRIDRPGYFQNGAQPPLPGLVQLVEETSGAGKGFVPV